MLVLVTEQSPLPFALAVVVYLLTGSSTMEHLPVPGTIAIDYIVVICRRTKPQHTSCFSIPAFAPRSFISSSSLVRF